jgi:phage tail-like protein
LGKQPGLIKFTNVILKKGITQSQDLHKWFNDVKNGKLERKKAIIFLDDFAGKEVKKWVCSNCWPVKYTIAELNAQGNQVLIENLELANEGVELQP